MPITLLDADLLAEAARELLALALMLNPEACPDERVDLAMAALAALVPSEPDPWLELALGRVLEQELDGACAS